MNLAEEEEEDEESREKREKEEKALCKKFQDILGHQVDAVVIGTRMVDSPCCLVSSEYGWGANMERIMRAQTLRDNSRAEFMSARKVMEVNPKHRIIKELQKRMDSDELAGDIINLLYESSLIDSGFTLDTPKRFVKRINNMICLGLSLEEDEIPDKKDDPNVKIEQMNDPNIMNELVKKSEIIEKHDRKLEEMV
jgi:molecular chaperone HtpG